MTALRSKAARAADYERLARELRLYQQFTMFAVNGTAPEATETVPDGDGVHEFQLYGTERADGGTLVDIYRYPGQTARASVHLFDDWLRSVAELVTCPTETAWRIRTAAERLERARLALWAEPTKGDSNGASG